MFLCYLYSYSLVPQTGNLCLVSATYSLLLNMIIYWGRGYVLLTLSHSLQSMRVTIGSWVLIDMSYYSYYLLLAVFDRRPGWAVEWLWGRPSPTSPQKKTVFLVSRVILHINDY